MPLQANSQWSIRRGNREKMNRKEPPITPQLWIANLIQAARGLADKEKQERRWLAPDRYAWERPEEVICSFSDDCVVDVFLEQYGESFSVEQHAAAFGLCDALNAFCDATPQVLDPAATLADPRWELVRQKATEFASAFEGKWPGTE